MLRHRVLVGVSLFCLIPSTLIAQEPGNRPDIGRLMGELRAGNNRSSVSELRQLDGQRSTTALDELADSLTTFIIASSGRDSLQLPAFHALVAIGRSGSSRSDGGTPYGGAGERLSRIIQQVPSWSGAALVQLARLHNRAEGIERLSAVARSDLPAAAAAIEILDHDAGEPGVAELRRLFRGPSLQSERARAVLSSVAARRGWTRRS